MLELEYYSEISADGPRAFRPARGNEPNGNCGSSNCGYDCSCTTSVFLIFLCVNRCLFTKRQRLLQLTRIGLFGMNSSTRGPANSWRSPVRETCGELDHSLILMEDDNFHNCIISVVMKTGYEECPLPNGSY